MNTLFFYASKIVWALISPPSLLYILLTAGIILLFLKKTRPAKIILGFSALILTLVAFLPVGKWVIYPLESRFPANPELPRKVDGIIVLGGAVDIINSYIWNQTELGGAADRYTAFVELARKYPRARLIFTGGSGALLDQEFKEADIARAFFDSMGVDLRRMEFERESRNTYENAINSKALMEPAAGENWVLVTSASHMPRSVGAFCEQDWPVIPWPVDHLSSPGRHLRVGFNLAGNLGLLDTAIREWTGLLAYSITGKTSAFFPAGCRQQE